MSHEHDPNCAWEIWKEMFLKITDAYEAVRNKKNRNNHNPWLTPELNKRLMFEREKLKAPRSQDLEHASSGLEDLA